MNYSTVPAQSGPADRRIYVTCHQCELCQHIGINDAADDLSACNDGSCGWHGPTPAEDRCPGCGDTGRMGEACPECGGYYVLLADADIVPTDEPGVRGTCETQPSGGSDA